MASEQDSKSGPRAGDLWSGAGGATRQEVRDTAVLPAAVLRAVELPEGVLTWCKENPRPIHPDTGGYVVVPFYPACTR